MKLGWIERLAHGPPGAPARAPAECRAGKIEDHDTPPGTSAACATEGLAGRAGGRPA